MSTKTELEYTSFELRMSSRMHEELGRHADLAGIPLEHFVQAFLYLSLKTPDMIPDDFIDEVPEEELQRQQSEAAQNP